MQLAQFVGELIERGDGRAVHRQHDVAGLEADTRRAPGHLLDQQTMIEPEPLLLPESSEPLGPRYHARVVQLVATERRLAENSDSIELVAEWPN